MPWRQTLYKSLSPAMRAALEALGREDASRLLEIRVRVDRPVQWVDSAGVKQGNLIVDRKEMDALLSALCGYSRYVFEAQMAQGFIPLPGGHRAGVCGRAVYEDGRIVRMSAISSVCIRIARTVEGASREIQEYLFSHGRPACVLLLGPPGCGKTTVLRDAAAYLARECRLRVAVADEREELFGDADDMDLDVLRGAGKADAVSLLIRTMSPQVVVCDEVGRMEDAQALLDAASCGVGVLASAHGDGFADVIRRPVLRTLFENRAFDRYILLKPVGKCAAVMDRNGKELMEENDGKLGCGGDGDGRYQCDRLFGGGRRKAPAAMGTGDEALSSSFERRHSI